MKRHSSLRPGSLTWSLLVILAAVTASRAEKGQNGGIYREHSGAPHAWTVHRSHLLEWDEKPYVPAGVVFHSAFLRAPSAETLQQDVAELDRLKSAGIEDVWVEPDRGLLENSTEQIQSLLDALEQRGFRYGLRVGDRHTEPLVGFSPTLPAVHVPASRLQPGTRQNWTVETPQARRAAYLLTDNSPNGKSQSWAIAAGEVAAESNTARIEIQFRNSRLLGQTRGLLHVVPEVQIPPDQLGSFGDLWGGMQAYAVRLKQRLQALKFGPGLRFLLDPFAAGDGSVGQEDEVFPSSPEFRKAFGEWIERRYGVGTINLNWRTAERQIRTREEAGRLVPLWPRNDPPEGDGWLFDPEDKVAYRCQPRASSIWRDLDAFRTVTLKRWMNMITGSLESEGLNVPMLFTWSAYHPVFNNTPSPTGYDGLGAQLYGAPDKIAQNSAAYAMAQAEEGDRNTWLIAARLGAGMDPNGKPTPIVDSNQLRLTWNAMRETGFRGVYLDPRDTPNAVSMAKELGTVLQSEAARLTGEVPRVCFFPLSLATADRVTRLSNGVWWVPAGGAAKLLGLGDTMRGYEITHPLGDTHPVQTGVVVWSTTGTREVTVFVPDSSIVSLHDSGGKPLKLDKRKREIRFKFGEEPVVVSGISAAALFPVELATEALREFEALLRAADAQKLDGAGLRGIYDQMRKNLDAGNAGIVYQTMQPYVQQLRYQLYPYVWLEGERCGSHNFTSVTFQAGCSTGTYLRLDRAELPVSRFYHASYFADLARDGTYEIWMAGKAPGSPGVSPLVWQVDDELPVTQSTVTPVGGEYAAGMTWFRLGQLTLKAGRHELSLAITQKAEGAGGRYVAGVDTVVFTRPGFQPRGIEKPAPVAEGPAPAAEKSRDRERDQKRGRDRDRDRGSDKGRAPDDARSPGKMPERAQEGPRRN